MARARPWLRCGRSTPDARRNASRPPSGKRLASSMAGHVAAAAQRLAGGDRPEELAVAVLGIVAGKALGGVVEQGLRLDESGVQGECVDERLERGAGRAPRAGAVDLAGDVGVVEIGGSDAGADLSGGGVQQHGGGIAQALRVPAIQEIADRLLDHVLLCQVERGGNRQALGILAQPPPGEVRGLARDGGGHEVELRIQLVRRLAMVGPQAGHEPGLGGGQRGIAARFAGAGCWGSAGWR